MNAKRGWVAVILAGASSLLAFANAREAAVVSDADEVKIGRILAQKYEAENGIGSSEQTRKLDAYLQKVGEKVAAGAERKLPYQFHFDANPGFRSAVGLPGGQIYVGQEYWRIWIPKISWQWCWDTKLNM